MMSWWKISGLGLLVSGMVVGCTITSDDDTGTGGSGTGTTGGTAATTGGSGGATGSSGAAGQATVGTGGTGGTQVGACTGITDERTACNTCLTTNCSSEFTACGAVCKAEFNSVRNCAVADTSAGTPDVKVGTCWDDNCGDNISEQTTALISCALSQTAAANCEFDCY